MNPNEASAPVPGDAWKGDRTLRDALRFRLGEESYAAAAPQLEAMGRTATSAEVRELVARAEREVPVHVPYSAWGARIDHIRVSDAYLELGRIGIVAGVTALPYEPSEFGFDARLVWAALVALWGPSSALYSCPVAMTDGAARTLLNYGDEEDAAVVERLTSRDPARAWTSGQWMTELSGGSDISGTETIARREGEIWRLYGTKWFTSATTSEMALTLARPEGAPHGSRGLALFRIHRLLDDGSSNAIFVRRLKDKLGTRSMPTAELELQGAAARPVGDVSDGAGVRRISTMLNITRMHNAIGSIGALARGLAWARAHARVRNVFGRPLQEMPAHLATLTDIAVDHAASVALVMRCAQLLGRSEHGSATSHEEALLRGLTPVAKLATARWAIAGVTETMECLGGVGYCEDSGMPALVRNTHVMPIWEGTTNVLSLDLLRAEERAGSLGALLTEASDVVERVASDPSVSSTCVAVKGAVGEVTDRLRSLDDPERAQSAARSVALSVARTYACALLCEQGAWSAAAGDGRTAAQAARLAARGLLEPDPPSELALGMDERL